VIQEKDREELVMKLKEFQEWTTNKLSVDESNKHYESIIQKLLQWKRGDRFWCQHFKWDWHLATWLYIPAFANESIMSEWKYCPICKEKRPGE